MILVDTSAWVEYDRASGSPVDARLIQLIAASGPLAVTEPVSMEVIAGARNARRESDLRRFLLSFDQVPFEAPVDFAAAARIYRRCRSVGVTPRGMIDCMIAAVAWRAGADLLAHDADLARVANVMSLPLDIASLRV